MHCFSIQSRHPRSTPDGQQSQAEEPEPIHRFTNLIQHVGCPKFQKYWTAQARAAAPGHRVKVNSADPIQHCAPVCRSLCHQHYFVCAQVYLPSALKAAFLCAEVHMHPKRPMQSIFALNRRAVQFEMRAALSAYLSDLPSISGTNRAVAKHKRK